VEVNQKSGGRVPGATATAVVSVASAGPAVPAGGNAVALALRAPTNAVAAGTIGVMQPATTNTEAAAAITPARVLNADRIPMMVRSAFSGGYMRGGRRAARTEFVQARTGQSR
jgi:hypothetical protein